MCRPSRRRRRPVPRIGLPSDRRGVGEAPPPRSPRPPTATHGVTPRAARSPGHLVGYVAVGGVGTAVDTTRCVGSRPTRPPTRTGERAGTGPGGLAVAVANLPTRRVPS
eukprot:444194-Pleurochrysis_carterae.AAC.1